MTTTPPGGEADPGMAPPHLAAYRGLMDRVGALVAGLDAEAAEQIVPATPEWSVRELLSHLVGVPADVLAGRIEGAATDPWTAAQVDARRDRSVSDLLAEWEDLWPRFSQLIPVAAEAMPMRANQMIFDALIHEQDLRQALDRPGGRDDPGWDLAWEFGVFALGELRDAAGAGALLLRPTDAPEVVAGAGEVTTRVGAPRFEFLRAGVGRRSVAQMEAWDWEGPWSPEQFCYFGPRDTDLIE